MDLEAARRDKSQRVQNAHLRRVIRALGGEGTLQCLFTIIGLSCLVVFIYYIASAVTLFSNVDEELFRNTPVITLNASNFTAFIDTTDRNVLVTFYAPWCGHCQKFKPELVRLAKFLENEPSVAIAAFDAWRFSQLADKYQVKGYPTILLFPAAAKESPVIFNGWSRNVGSLLKFLEEKSSTYCYGFSAHIKSGFRYTSHESSV
eukprot:jgi/Galph1/346/GphlegSOOS_G5015.1